MRMHKLVRGGIVAAVASGLILAGSVAPATAAATQTPGFAGGWYPVYWDSGETLPFSTTFDWQDNVPATPTAAGSVFDIDDPSERFLFTHQTQSAEVPWPTTGVVTFVSPRGKENSPSEWNAWEPRGLTEPGVWLPNMAYGNFTMLGGGNPAGAQAIKGAGGQYSVGLAFTSINGLRVSLDGVYFQHMTVEAGSGDWTIDPIQPPSGHVHGTPYGAWDQTLFNGGGGWVQPTAPGEEETASAEVQAEVVSEPPVDGELELIAPFASPVVLDEAALNQNNQSVSTGSLGSVTVKDARALSRPGWTLTAELEDFVLQGGTDTIAKSAFGLKPLVVSGATGATAGAEQIAGSATYGATFAERAAGTYGDSVLGADLRFLAPEFATAGTYESTLTLTLVTK